MATKNPGKQRKRMHTAPLHAKRKMASSHLEGSLIKKHNVRSVPVKTGDTVTIMRGKFKGYSGKVITVNTRDQKVVIEGVTLTKADGKDVEFPIDPSNLLITKLDLSDPRRKEKLERLGGA
ncbi:MAG: 50S ribosomal protein L24 [Candidatus Thermoplasmatota archaeon]|nr:50S ribosomal protein L24 [Candidatus Thermoplasmatota archaeon]